MFALSWRELNEVTMQIGTCLNTSFLLSSSNSGGGANEKKRGTEVRREEEKGKKKTSELPFRAYARFAILSSPWFLQSLYWIFLQYCFISWICFWLRGRWALSSPTRDQTWTPYLGKWSHKYWTSREIPHPPLIFFKETFSSIQFSHSVVSKSLPPMGCSMPGLCPSANAGVYPNPCPLSQWCHPTISSSVVPFSSCLQSCPASGSFQMSQLFASGGQSIGVSASTSVLSVNTQD